MFLIYSIFVRGIVDAKIESIKIRNLGKGDSAEDYCLTYGISKDKANDVIKDPSNYRLITYDFDFRNKLLINKLAYIEFNGIHDSKLKQNIIGYTTHEWGEYPIFIKPGESNTIPISVLVKVNGYKDDEIYELCKHSKFTMSGHVFGIKFNLKTLKCN